MKKDLHLKKVYVAVVLTAITIIPAAFAIGVFLDNTRRSDCKTDNATFMSHQQTEILSEDVHH